VTAQHRRPTGYLGSERLTYVLTTARERMEMVARAHWALEMDWGEVVRIAQFLDACRIDAGTPVFSEGDKRSYMCLLVEGEVSVRKGEQILDRLVPGSSFGEMSLLDGSPRSATVLAESDALVLILTRENFQRLAEECPRLVLRMVMRIANMINDRLRETSRQLANGRTS